MTAASDQHSPQHAAVGAGPSTTDDPSNPGGLPLIDAESLNTDEDSTYGDDDLQSYTTSLASSVENYPYDKYGRRYHAYREGTYVLPNDEKEQDRLDISHHLCRLAIGGDLYAAPVQNPKRILDVGTGTGIWAIEIADAFPEAEVIGNDFSPIQPTWVPPNVKFEVDDCESEWPDREPFDFIHVRYMCGSIQDWPRLVQQCYNQTAPNGWVQFLDYEIRMYSDLHPIDPENGVYKIHKLIAEACEKIGRTLTPGPLIKGWVEQAGFKNVVHRRIPAPMGHWPKNKAMKELGAFNMLQFLQGIEAFAGVIEKVLGWSSEEAQVLVAQGRNDAKKKGVHMLFNLHLVYGQRIH